jgi:cytochrome c-type biogenesis protein CcmH
MIAALFAFAAALLVTGWIAARTSRRAARLWAFLALVALAGASAFQIMREPGPWWPLLHWPWSLAECAATLVWMAALALSWRARQRGWRTGQVLLACGVAAFGFCLIAATIGQSESERGRVCPGAPARLDRWTVTLRSVEPVVGEDFTGVEAGLLIGFPGGAVLQARPQQRDYPRGSPGLMAGSQVLERWNGELLVINVANHDSPECAELLLEWQPFGQWLRYGAWASLAGALVLLATAARSAAWRAAARRRIAMRRDDHGRGALAATPFTMGWKPVILALICGATAFAWASAQRPPNDPPRRGGANGAALIAARQAQFGGPHLDNRWLVIADALARHGQFGEAAQVLLGAVAKQPGNAEAWLALGDALYGHAGGEMVAAAVLAYNRADRVAAPQPAVKSVVAGAMAASGRERAAAEWLCRDYLPYRQCPD